MALEQFRRAGGDLIPLIRMFLKHLIQIEKKHFFLKKGTFNEVSHPRTLYLTEIGPGH